MSNARALFITTRTGGNYGSSLYMVTAHWVLRCSGNTNGRTAETFIRRRECTYVLAETVSAIPSVGAYPREGGHNGNEITSILATGANLLIPDAMPEQWVAQNGVLWATAVAEINAAILYAQSMSGDRASRVVGGAFHLNK